MDILYETEGGRLKRCDLSKAEALGILESGSYAGAEKALSGWNVSNTS